MALVLRNQILQATVSCHSALMPGSRVATPETLSVNFVASTRKTLMAARMRSPNRAIPTRSLKARLQGCRPWPSS